MIKKIFPFFLLTILILIVYAFVNKSTPLNIEEKKNPTSITSTINKNQEKGKLSANQPKIFLQINQPSESSTVKSSILKIIGTTLPNAYVFINDLELRSDVIGNFSTEITIDEGDNEIVIVVSDELGNSAEKDIRVALESTE